MRRKVTPEYHLTVINPTFTIAFLSILWDARYCATLRMSTLIKVRTRITCKAIPPGNISWMKQSLRNQDRQFTI